MCTGIQVRSQDGGIVFARTMEFGPELASQLVVLPRGKSYTGSTPQGQPGITWSSKYQVVGMNAFDVPFVTDGLNEQGFYCGIFYFPGYAVYQDVSDDDIQRTLGSIELATYLLGNCRSVEEALQALDRVRVANVVVEQMKTVPPCHYFIGDAAGRCAVIEYTKDGLKTYDDPLGVITNSPTFDWHMTNLRNYLHLTPTNVPTLNLSGLHLSGFGMGSGMLGLPGDFTAPSRFIRAVAMTQAAYRTPNSEETVTEAFHILNQFDIPWGVARTDNGDAEQERTQASRTQWTSAADVKRLRYYYHTQKNRRLHVLDLQRVDSRDKEYHLVLPPTEDVEDMTPALR